MIDKREFMGYDLFAFSYEESEIQKHFNDYIKEK